MPDLFLALPRGGYAGLWIEMKARGGQSTVEQFLWLKKLDNVGYVATTCFSFGQAKDTVVKYLNKNNITG